MAGPVVWNSLPAALRDADSLYSFNRKLKKISLIYVLMTDRIFDFVFVHYYPECYVSIAYLVRRLRVERDIRCM